MDDADPPREVLAVHEAGHAVIAWRLQIEFLSVDIEKKRTEYPDTTVDCDRAAHCTAAGPLAQKELCPDYRDRAWSHGDTVRFQELTEKKAREDIGERWDRMSSDEKVDAIADLQGEIIVRVKGLVRKNERHVKALAEKLVAETRIEGATAMAFLEALDRPEGELFRRPGA